MRIDALVRQTPQHSSCIHESRFASLLCCFFRGLTGDAQARPRNCVQPPSRNRLVAPFTETIGAIFDFRESRLNLVH